MSKIKTNKYSELFSNILIFAFANIGAKAIMFLLLPLYTNILTAEEYGTIELMTTAVNLIIPICTLSISDSITRFGLDRNISSHSVVKVTTVFLLFVAIVIVSATPLFSLYKTIAPYLWLFTASLVSQIFRTSYTLYLKIIDKNILFAIDTILYTFLFALQNVIYLAIFGWGVNGYILSLIVSNSCSILFCFLTGRIFNVLCKTKFDFGLLKKMLVYSSPMIFNAISWWITNSSDKFMLEYYLTVSDVGIYSTATKIPSILSVFSSLFAQAWTISSIKEYDSTKDKHFYTRVFEIYCVSIIMASAFILLIIKPFMRFYIGEEFIDSWKFVPQLLIAAAFNAISVFFGAIYSATKKNIQCTTSTIICGVSNIILNLLLIPRFGVMGASVATAISYAVVAIYRMADCQTFFKFYIDYKKHGLAFLLVILEAFCAITINKSYLPNSIIIVILVFIYRTPIIMLMKYAKGFIEKLLHTWNANFRKEK